MLLNDIFESFSGMSEEQAKEFAQRWLPAWTGNRPELLATFYTDDVFYADPTVPEGLRGKAALLGYLTVLLRDNPDWNWTQTRSAPMRDGFVNYWRLQAPVGDTVVTCDGVCLVQVRDGLIYRNEVFFDPAPMIDAIRAWNVRKRAQG